MYAVLHPPNFYAQAAAHGRPELHKRPFVVLDGEPPTETVFAVGQAARSLGAEVGITRLQAETLPGVIVLRREIEREAAVHTALHDVACRFSPRIERVEERPGTYALDVQGMSGLFGEPPELARKLRQAIETAGVFANVAVAESFHAAVCLASGKRGISVVPPGCERDALSQLPLGVLDLAPEYAATFAS